MIVFGIETSCDETAAAIVEDGTKILSNAVASSQDIHIKTGGIIPENAARQQIKSILPVINQATNKAFPKINPGILLPDKIDAIAITHGPGLVGSLLVGVETAKTVSCMWNKPIVPVNHLIGHIYANWLSRDVGYNIRDTKINPKFPAIALVVSGGHTDLVLIKDHGKIVWIGGTRDDAAGEAFDKTARLLGLPYPGGPSISESADHYFSRSQKSEVRSLNLFPRPMINSNNFDFSFSGLKTAVLNYTKNIKIQENKNLSKSEICKLSAEVQEAIVDVLVSKSINAIKEFKPESFLLSGGVAANQRLREKLILKIANRKLSIDLFIPHPSLCTDNAAYIASAAYFNYKPVHWKKIVTNPQLRIGDNIV
jgi:N6-L-threonylcarbamoyladenine synthase